MCATFAHAIRSTNPTAPSTISSGVSTLPTTFSFSGVTATSAVRAGILAFQAGGNGRDVRARLRKSNARLQPRENRRLLPSRL